VVRVRRASRGPFALHLELNPESQRHAIHEIVVSDDARRIVDCRIAQPDPSQVVYIPRRHPGGSQGELQRIRHECARARWQYRCTWIAGKRSDQMVVLRNETERLSVMANSIMALVGGRDRNREHLTLGARQLRLAEHQLPIELQVRKHRLWA